ncbi:MAG: NAD(P)-dependent alcohol dehydrogenase [Cyclobacteriaceae bacterium]
MKAAVLIKYGSADNLEVVDSFEPNASDLKKREVLINVKASSVNPIDYKVRNGRLKWAMSPKFPKIMGSDFSGVILSSQHHLFKAGEEVYGYITTTKGGAYAEKLIMKGKKIGRKPKNFTHQETAALPMAGITALQALRDIGGIKEGDQVLINGCAGGVGHLAVQIAKYYQASVTGICSTGKIDYAKSLRTDRIIDYKQEDIHDRMQQYRIIFDTVGNLSFQTMKPYLSKKGIFVATNVYPGKVWAMITSIFSARKARIVLANANHDDFQFLSNLSEHGHLKPYIEKEYPLKDIADAQKHLEKGHVQGKIVVNIA